MRAVCCSEPLLASTAYNRVQRVYTCSCCICAGRAVLAFVDGLHTCRAVAARASTVATIYNSCNICKPSKRQVASHTCLSTSFSDDHVEDVRMDSKALTCSVQTTMQLSCSCCLVTAGLLQPVVCRCRKVPLPLYTLTPTSSSAMTTSATAPPHTTTAAAQCSTRPLLSRWVGFLGHLTAGSRL